VMFALMEDLLYELPDTETKDVTITRESVRERLEKLVQDEDLRKYIL